MYVLENFKVLRYANGQFFLVTETEFLNKILKLQGDPGRPVIRENIHWIPHKDPTIGSALTGSR